MECSERITDTYQSSMPCRIAPVATCLERLELLARAATDKALRRESLAVLIKYALNVNSELGIAWITQQRVSQELGISKTQLSRAIKQLEELGYMVRSHEPPRPGWKACTVYRLYVPVPESEAQNDVITGDYTPECQVTTGDNHEFTPVVTAEFTPVIPKHRSVNRVLNPVLRNHPSADSGGGAAARRNGPSSTTQPPRPRPLPEDWEPSEKAIINAMAECQLSREQVAHQTRRFTSHSRSRGLLSADWLEDWWRWVDNVRPGTRWRRMIETEDQNPSGLAGVMTNIGPLTLMTETSGGW